MSDINEIVDIEGQMLKLTNLDKVYWPDANLTKAHLIKYYLDMSPYIMPFIHNRPLVMKRYPDGIDGESFYQKECPSYAPEWVETYPVKHSHKVVNYIVCNNKATLIWMANQGCLEIHGWLSRLEQIDYPDLAVIDLDPAEGATFQDVLKIALMVKEALNQFNIEGIPKTSGASGLHIFIPMEPEYTFAEITETIKALAEIIVRAYPQGVTIERSVSKRRGKVYFDYLQNGRGKTMAFPYSVRPLPGAPVSMPLSWLEIKQQNLAADKYKLANALEHVKRTSEQRGLLDVSLQRQSLASLVNAISYSSYRNQASLEVKPTIYGKI